jgi:hypothetical protein
VPLQITCSMMLGMRAFLALLMLLVCASAHAQPPKAVVLQGETGGKLDEHWYRFKALAATGAEVEVRGKCQSACTMITGVIPKSRLCFAEGSHLAFHWARHKTWDGEPDQPGT